jgi:hypothetical protein
LFFPFFFPEVRMTPTRTEVIIRATKTKEVLGDKGRRIRELTSVVQVRKKKLFSDINIFFLSSVVGASRTAPSSCTPSAFTTALSAPLLSASLSSTSCLLVWLFVVLATVNELLMDCDLLWVLI